MNASSSTVTHSYWLDSDTGVSTSIAEGVVPPAGLDLEVIVIGGGLAGLLTALELSEQGARVALFEAGTVAGRTTGHSTAKVTALHGSIYHELAAHKGLDAAACYADANLRGVERIRSLIRDLDIDCDAVDAPAYTCVEADVSALEKEYEAALACGLAVTWEVPTELPFPIAGAIMLADQLHIDPVKLCKGLVTRLRTLGTSVFEGAPVTGVREEADGCIVEGPGFVARCDVAVLTTHLPIVDPALLAGRTTPVRSYVVAGQSTAAAPKGMYLAADAGWSVRPAGPGRRTILVGGEGHSMLDDVDSAPHLERLEAWAGERFGMQVTHRWSAFDYRSADGLPFVGRLAPGAQRRYVATGFGKWGMSMSAVAADVIADSIGGRTTATTDLFDATRLLATVGGAAVKHNLKVSKHFVGDRLRPSLSIVKDATELEPGTGVVIRRGTGLVALSRGLDGSTHSVDAACTHLGCIVGFNSGEQTWDCPCHGSRFTLDGQVLDGPASEALEAVEARS